MVTYTFSAKEGKKYFSWKGPMAVTFLVTMDLCYTTNGVHGNVCSVEPYLLLELVMQRMGEFTQEVRD